MKRFRKWLARVLDVKVEPKRVAFVADVEWHRSEELRVDRLGPTVEDIQSHQPDWVIPGGARVDRWRPSSTLGPM